MHYKRLSGLILSGINGVNHYQVHYFIALAPESLVTSSLSISPVVLVAFTLLNMQTAVVSLSQSWR